MNWKKELSMLWLIWALFIFPCILNLENMGCCAFIMVDMIAAFKVAKKNVPEIFND